MLISWILFTVISASRFELIANNRYCKGLGLPVSPGVSTFDECKQQCDLDTRCFWVIFVKSGVCRLYEDCVLTSFQYEDGTTDTRDRGIRIYKKLTGNVISVLQYLIIVFLFFPFDGKTPFHIILSILLFFPISAHFTCKTNRDCNLPLLHNATSQDVYSFFHSDNFAHMIFEESCILIRTNGFYLDYRMGSPRLLFKENNYCLFEEGCTRKIKFLDGSFYNKKTPKWAKKKKFNGKYLSKALEKGWTVTMEQFHKYPKLTGVRALAKLFSKALGRRMNANGYLTPMQIETGLDAHNDQHGFIVCQIMGAKRWTVWRKDEWMLPLVNPQRSVGTRQDNKLKISDLGEPDSDIILRPGDLFYVPRGAVHATTTLVDYETNSPSYHITFAIAPDAFHLPWVTGSRDAPGVPSHNYLQAMFEISMRALWEKHTKFRKTVRIGGESPQAWKERVREAMHAGIDEMLDHSPYLEFVEMMFDRIIESGNRMIEPDETIGKEFDFDI